MRKFLKIIFKILWYNPSYFGNVRICPNKKISFIYFIIVQCIQHNIFTMATLRTAFLETINPTNKPFYTIIAYLPLYGHQATATDDLIKQRITTPKIESPRAGKSRYLKPLSDFKNAGYKTIKRLINLNINNFSQLLDTSTNDFKDCENLVHVLDLHGQDEDDFRLSDIDTIQSFTVSLECSTGDGRNKLSNDGFRSSQDSCNQSNISDDFSQVEDIQADV